MFLWVFNPSLCHLLLFYVLFVSLISPFQNHVACQNFTLSGPLINNIEVRLTLSAPVSGYKFSQLISIHFLTESAGRI